MLAPLLALGFFGLVTAVRAHRVLHVTAVGQPASPAAFRPALIVPGHLSDTYKWLDHTNQMFALGEWRVRHVDYDNAPGGHDVLTPSPYRWWLGAIALAWNAVTGATIGRCVEGAALVGDPLLLVLLGAATVVFVARKFGGLAAAFLSVGLVAVYPFAGEFFPGACDDRGLLHLLALWSVLPLLAAALSTGEGLERRAKRAYVLAGLAGGFGLWISPAAEVPVLVGVGLGGLLSAWLGKPAPKDASAPSATPEFWRAWGLAGAVTCLAAYIIEFFPGYMGAWELRAVHPVYGIAWMGGAELVARASIRIRGDRQRVGVKGWGLIILSVAALASIPVSFLLTHSTDYLMEDLSTLRLSILPDGPFASSLWSWLLQNGFTPVVVATLLPLLVLVVAIVVLSLRRFDPARRGAIALALGPLLVALGFAFKELSWWNGVDAALLLLTIVLVGGLEGIPGRVVIWVVALAAAAIVLPGVVHLLPPFGSSDELTHEEVVGLVERDLSYWMERHVGESNAIVLAPPNTTASLYYYGGIRGLGTFDWESRDGTKAAVRIVSALTPEESQELINRRGITHIIIPGWDPYLDAYARIGEGQVGSTFLERLHLWLLPSWLKPISYPIPTISGFEGQSVAVLEVVEEQDDSLAASRLAEYFLDMGQMDLVANASKVLRRFPADLGALVAKAEIALAEGENDEFTQDVDVIVRRITGGADQTLAWDQRVNLAVVLAQGHHVDLARTRLKQCLDEADEEKLRSLSTNSLYRMHVLRKALGLTIKDPSRLELALELLPPDLRERLKE